MEKDYSEKVIFAKYDVSMVAFRCGFFSGVHHFWEPYLNSTVVLFDT